MTDIESTKLYIAWWGDGYTSEHDAVLGDTRLLGITETVTRERFTLDGGYSPGQLADIDDLTAGQFANCSDFPNRIHFVFRVR